MPALLPDPDDVSVTRPMTRAPEMGCAEDAGRASVEVTLDEAALFETTTPVSGVQVRPRGALPAPRRRPQPFPLVEEPTETYDVPMALLSALREARDSAQLRIAAVWADVDVDDDMRMTIRLPAR